MEDDFRRKQEGETRRRHEITYIKWDIEVNKKKEFVNNEKERKSKEGGND